MSSNIVKLNAHDKSDYRALVDSPYQNYIQIMVIDKSVILQKLNSSELYVVPLNKISW